MTTKYKLLNTLAEFDAKEAEIKTLLSIPDDAGTSKYAESVMIDNPDHANYKMFLFPVITNGKWKCDQNFTDDELVEYDIDWLNEEVT
jgi:hypothetical protein